MDNQSLSQIYDEIKSEINRPIPTPNNSISNVGGPGTLQYSPKALAWRNQATSECEKLKDGCAKRLLLDIYVKALPLDQNYIDGNQGIVKGDIDNFLQSKGMSATQYLTSCHEKTKAPLLEYIIRSCNNIGKEFMKEAEETLKDAQKSGVNVPPPQADPNSEETDAQLIDIQKDTEYGEFIEALKKETMNKIVDDVSTIINKTKETDNMKFDPRGDSDFTESTINVVCDYIHQRMLKEGVELTPNQEEEIIGMAIREATLNLIDVNFKQPNSDIRPFTSRIRFGKGFVVTESAISNIKKLS